MDPPKKIKLETCTRTMTHSSLHDILRGMARIEDIQAFLDRDKSSINKMDECGMTPLLLLLSKDNCSIDIVQLFIQYGANVNIPDKNGKIPLCYAVRYNDEALVRTLIEAPGFSYINEVNVPNYNSPLILAIKNKCSPNIVKILLQYGANVNYKDNRGNTLLHYAIKSKSDEALIRALLEDPNFSSINDIDNFNRTPLLCAIQFKCSVSIIELLLQCGSKTSFKGTSVCSPLYFAFEFHCNEAVIRALLEAPDLDINEVKTEDFSKTTPLYSAIFWQCPSTIVEILLQHGANINCKDGYGRSPLDYALTWKGPLPDEATVKLLIKYSYLKIKNFSALHQNKGYREYKSIASECAEELQKMVAVEVSPGRTLRDLISEDSSPHGGVADNNEELKDILDQLLTMRIDIVCPVYFDMILVKIGKQVMVSKLHELLVDSVKNFNSESGLEKVLLNYECASKIAERLYDEELFKLILTFYTPVEEVLRNKS